MATTDCYLEKLQASLRRLRSATNQLDHDKMWMNLIHQVDNVTARWQPDPTILTSQYDRIAVFIMQQTRKRPWAVPVRRCKLHDESFGNLCFRVRMGK